jgi:hypothetical protein
MTCGETRAKGLDYRHSDESARLTESMAATPLKIARSHRRQLDGFAAFGNGTGT